MFFFFFSGTIMDPAGHSGTDQTDHHSYPYKNEVSLSIGGGGDQPATISPTPTPRNSNNGKPREQPPSVPSSAQHKDSSAMLARADEKRSGLDNPGFENEPTKSARPLSSFGQNGHSEAAKSQNGNGTTPVTNGSEKPLAGNMTCGSKTVLKLNMTDINLKFNRSRQLRVS